MRLVGNDPVKTVLAIFIAAFATRLCRSEKALSDIAVAIRVNISSLRSIWAMLPRQKTFTGKTCVNFVDSDQSGHEWRSPKYLGVR